MNGASSVPTSRCLKFPASLIRVDTPEPLGCLFHDHLAVSTSAMSPPTVR
jgi:hypothetical protein